MYLDPYVPLSALCLLQPTYQMARYEKISNRLQIDLWTEAVASYMTRCNNAQNSWRIVALVVCSDTILIQGFEAGYHLGCPPISCKNIYVHHYTSRTFPVCRRLLLAENVEAEGVVEVLLPVPSPPSSTLVVGRR